MIPACAVAPEALAAPYAVRLVADEREDGATEDREDDATAPAHTVGVSDSRAQEAREHQEPEPDITMKDEIDR